MKKVKICGIKIKKDIEIVNKYKPDYCGFIINFPKSHRNITPREAEELAEGLCPEVKAVGVFVNQPAELVADLLNNNIISIAQLHGNEDNSYIRELKRLTDKSIWQAFQINCGRDVEKAQSSLADYVLLDAGQGAGRVFDWRLLDNIKRPFGLAGGLNISNIGEALKTKAELFDVSGGVEKDKFKNEELVRQFIDIVRNS